MLNKIVLLGLFASILPFNITAQKHPIDKKYDACMNDKPIRECAAIAYEDWDAELNKVYKQLLANTVQKSSIEATKNVQRQWIVFRDAEMKASGAVYGYIYDQNDGGTMYIDIQNDAYVGVVRDRALQIAALEQDLKETFLEKPIHELYATCSGKDQKSLNACITKAYAKWDAELNKEYKRLLAATKDKSLIEAVKNAQRQWLVLRDAEFKQLTSTYAFLSQKNKNKSDYYQLVELHTRAKFVQDRALELSSQVENLKQFAAAK